MGALVAGCGVFLAATWGREAPEPAGVPDQPARQVVPFEPLQAAPTVPAAPPTLRPDASGPYVPALQPEASASNGAERAADRRNDLATIRAAPILAFSRRSAVEVAPEGLSTDRAASPAADPAKADELASLMAASPIGRARATRLPDRNFLLAAGAAIPCLLQTAMDSATPGFVSCVIPQDVYSDNGAVVLLEKGTRVLGEYRGGLRQGQRRLFVLWTRAVTPSGVAIALGS
ncbi:MAG TPA: TrbI/VirB10 family protein, partial [Phenylobacterium sp.]|nr:TrbI/VirB10 family protein [Phenylobacterium sp.]